MVATCVEDGKKLKTLKRHLMVAYGMTPEQYSEKWGRPHDFRMVAPSYAARRANWRRRSGSVGSRRLLRHRRRSGDGKKAA
jgi:predicted transcriptional regulator